jgi:hypothetical protein
MNRHPKTRRAKRAVAIAIALAIATLAVNFTGIGAESQVAGTYVPREIQAVTAFPESITFSLRGEAPFELERIELLYSIADDLTLHLATPPFEPGSEIDIQHDLRMQVNFVPVGVDVRYQWRLTGVDGTVAETEPETFMWKDDRFDWESVTNDQVTVFSYHGNEAFSHLILDTAQATIDRLRTDFAVNEVPPIRIWAYTSVDDFQGTQLKNSESWIAGTAYPEYHVIQAVLPEGDRYEVGRIVPHEISHQVLHQATRNPFNAPPVWLDEGLAVLNQEGGDEDYPALVHQAAEQGRLFSIPALISSQPLDAADAALYYAESLSVVQFVIDHFGAEKIAVLIDAYREGVSHDDAALRALGVDLEELDRLWKASLGYQGDRGQAGGITPETGNDGASLLASGALVMTIAAVAAIAAAMIVIRRSALPEESEESEEQQDLPMLMDRTSKARDQLI